MGTESDVLFLTGANDLNHECASRQVKHW